MIKNRWFILAGVFMLLLLLLAAFMFWLNAFYFVEPGFELVPRRGRCMWPCVPEMRRIFVQLGLSPF